MRLERTWNKKSGIIAGLVCLAILESFSIMAIGIIGNNYQTLIWFKEFPHPIYIWFIFIPITSTLLGLGIARRSGILTFFGCILGIGIIAWPFYYLVRIFWQ